MSRKNEYTIAFRGDIIATFTSVYPAMHIVVGYRKPMSPIAVLARFKTEGVAVKEVKDIVRRDPVNTMSAHSAFVVPVTPGVTEVSACPISYAMERRTGVLV